LSDILPTFSHELLLPI